ncbi:MAG: DUF92 domain-containing protein [Anaerolineae bacterium]|nr:MAG: DUF92 domain-containing protein [Anaerolineae bacterium]
MQIFTGFLLAALIAFAAYRAHSLSTSGALGATLVGGVIFGAGGWQWAILLLAFFITSTALTRAFKKRKTGLNEKFSKGGQRDIGQVLGNGGLAALFAGLWFFWPGEAWIWAAFAASLAAVNADTWATELGVLNPHPPRLITKPLQVVEKGTSGGISLFGTLAALAGAGLIGLLAVLVSPQTVSPLLGLLVTLAGLAGSLFDSLLGATLQAIYHCPTCHKETEHHPLHTCGTQTTLKRGWPWLNNDWVNFACAAFGALLAILFL